MHVTRLQAQVQQLELQLLSDTRSDAVTGMAELQHKVLTASEEVRVLKLERSALADEKAALTTQHEQLLKEFRLLQDQLDQQLRSREESVHELARLQGLLEAKSFETGCPCLCTAMDARMRTRSPAHGVANGLAPTGRPMHAMHSHASNVPQASISTGKAQRLGPVVGSFFDARGRGIVDDVRNVFFVMH